MAQYTKLLENEIQEIAGKYKLTIIAYEPIEQGAANSNYVLVTKRDKYILTVFEIEPITVTQMSKVLLLLADRNFPAPRIKTLANGNLLTKYQGKPVLLKPFISGQVIKDLDRNKVNQAGTAMARLHEIPIPDYLPDKHSYVKKTYPKVMKKGIDQKYNNWLGQGFRRLMQNIPSGLPIGLIHGDLFYDNILFEGEKFKAFLDFEDICQTYKVFDLGMAVVGLCTEDTKIVLTKVRAIVNGYQEVRLLEEVEKESLQIFIEYAALLTSAWRFWKYNMDAPNAEKSNNHMQMVNIAKAVRSIPKTFFMNTVFA